MPKMMLITTCKAIFMHRLADQREADQWQSFTSTTCESSCAVFGQRSWHSPVSSFDASLKFILDTRRLRSSRTSMKRQRMRPASGTSIQRGTRKIGRTVSSQAMETAQSPSSALAFFVKRELLNLLTNFVLCLPYRLFACTRDLP